MNKVFFMEGLLKKIGDVNFIKGVVHKALCAIAGFIAIMGFFIFFQILTELGRLPGAMTFVGFIFALAVIVITYIVVHTLVIRASEFKNLKLDKYPMITMISRLIRLVGEVFASYMIPFSVAMGLLIIFSSGGDNYIIYYLLEPFPFVPGLGAIVTVTGIFVMLWGLIVSLGAFLIAYAISELLILFTDIANK